MLFQDDLPLDTPYKQAWLFRIHYSAAVLKMLFLADEPAKKAEINILTARNTTGPGF